MYWVLPLKLTVWVVVVVMLVVQASFVGGGRYAALHIVHAYM